MINKIGIWFWVNWDASDGKLLRVRYAAGKLHNRLCGYDPDSNQWQFRLAHWLGLSGYDPSRFGWAARFYRAYTDDAE
jgi:hypothetical protein